MLGKYCIKVFIFAVLVVIFSHIFDKLIFFFTFVYNKQILNIKTIFIHRPFQVIYYIFNSMLMLVVLFTNLHKKKF